MPDVTTLLDAKSVPAIRRLLIVDSLPRVHGWKLLRRTLRETQGDTGTRTNN